MSASLFRSNLFGVVAFLFSTSGSAFADSSRVFGPDFFSNFAPQTALEMIEQVPGFIISEADVARGLSQGGTNILLDGQPITGKGESPTAQLEQIAATNVLRIELIEASELNLPGFEGLVANVITQRSEFTGSWEWSPEWRPRNEANFGNGNLRLSGRKGNWNYSAGLTSTMVRAGFFGPETLASADGSVFEDRDESFLIRGEQPGLSGSIGWKGPTGIVLNAKGSLDRLNLQRPQTSRTTARSPLGMDSLNRSLQSQDQTNFNFDFDITFPAFSGDLKLIGLVDVQDNALESEVIEVSSQNELLLSRLFEEQASRDEGILRFEQS